MDSFDTIAAQKEIKLREAAMFWSAHALSGDYDELFNNLEQATPVRLMATMGELETAYRDEPLGLALERAKPQGFDFLPVRDRESSSIVGLLRTQSISTSECSVGEAMEPLTSAILIGADAPLLRFVCEADRTPCRLVLDGTAISGIVTLSDMQRLPVRTALFSLFIHLEMMLTTTLRELVTSNFDPIEQLSEKDRKKLCKSWERSVNDGIQRDKWSVLMFGHKRDIAAAQPALEDVKDSIIKEFADIQKYLRNPFAHANDWALTREGACKLAEAARLLRKWTIWFREKRRERAKAVPLVSVNPEPG